MAAVLTDRDCRWRLSRPADLPARLFEWIVSKYGHDPAKASLSEKRVADESPTGRNQRTVGLRLLPSPTTTLIQASVPERPIALPAERCSCAARCASSSARSSAHSTRALSVLSLSARYRSPFFLARSKRLALLSGSEAIASNSLIMSFRGSCAQPTRRRDRSSIHLGSCRSGTNRP